MTTNPDESKQLKRTGTGPQPALPKIHVPEHGSEADGNGHGLETWISLCAQATVEQDPKRFLELVSEINRLLDSRRQRLEHEADLKRNEH